jgi:hypothetical protein
MLAPVLSSLAFHAPGQPREPNRPNTETPDQYPAVGQKDEGASHFNPRFFAHSLTSLLLGLERVLHPPGLWIGS